MKESTIIQKLTFNKALTDTEFAKEIFRQLPFDTFDTEAEKILAKQINRYYLTNDNTMTEKTLKMYVEKQLDKGLEQEEAAAVIQLVEDVYAVTTEMDEEVAVEELDKHIRRSLTLKTLKEFISGDKLDDESALENLGKEITNISLLDTSNSGDENFLDLFNDTERKIELYNKLRTKTHPTGYTEIDSMLDGGGLGRGEVALFIAPTGSGKALTNGTIVHTPEGPVAIERLTEGSKVFGTDGKPHNVIGVFPQGKKRVYEIEFSDGTIIENNDEHIWTFQTSHQRSVSGEWTTTTLRDMIDNYDIIKTEGNSVKRNMYLPITEPVKYSEKEYVLDPYSMGQMVAEGVDGAEEAVPKEYKYGSVSQRLTLLQGVIDTKGMVQGSRVTYTTISEHLARDIKDIANSLGMVGFVTHKHIDGEKKNTVVISVDREGLLPFSSEKHKAKFNYGQTGARRYVVDIRETERYEEMTCISVDAEDKLFLTENYIPTHNTSLAIQTAINYVNQGLNVLYVTLEEKMERIAVRLESNLLGAHLADFYDERDLINEDLIRAAGESYKASDSLGNLYISKHNPREVSAEKLEQIIIQTKLRKGLDVDFVVIDYPALMSVPGRNKVHEEQGELFERIRGLAQKYDFIALTLAQTNRTAWSADVVTLNNIEGGFMVANACELVLTVNRTQEEYEAGYFRMHVDKVRNRSSKPIPDILSFSVDPKGYRMTSSTPQERDKHFNILKQAGRDDGSDGFDRANDRVSNINKQLEGGQ